MESTIRAPTVAQEFQALPPYEQSMVRYAILENRSVNSWLQEIPSWERERDIFLNGNFPPMSLEDLNFELSSWERERDIILNENFSSMSLEQLKREAISWQRDYIILYINKRYYAEVVQPNETKYAFSRRLLWLAIKLQKEFEEQDPGTLQKIQGINIVNYIIKKKELENSEECKRKQEVYYSLIEKAKKELNSLQHAYNKCIVDFARLKNKQEHLIALDKGAKNEELNSELQYYTEELLDYTEDLLLFFKKKEEKELQITNLEKELEIIPLSLDNLLSIFSDMSEYGPNPEMPYLKYPDYHDNESTYNPVEEFHILDNYTFTILERMQFVLTVKILEIDAQINKKEMELNPFSEYPTFEVSTDNLGTAHNGDKQVPPVNPYEEELKPSSEYPEVPGRVTWDSTKPVLQVTPPKKQDLVQAKNSDKTMLMLVGLSAITIATGVTIQRIFKQRALTIASVGGVIAASVLGAFLYTYNNSVTSGNVSNATASNINSSKQPVTQID